MEPRREILEPMLKAEIAEMGDKNSKFFNATTIQRRKRNRIQRLKLQDESWREAKKMLPKSF